MEGIVEVRKACVSGLKLHNFRFRMKASGAPKYTKYTKYSIQMTWFIWLKKVDKELLVD